MVKRDTPILSQAAALHKVMPEVAGEPEAPQHRGDLLRLVQLLEGIRTADPRHASVCTQLLVKLAPFADTAGYLATPPAVPVVLRVQKAGGLRLLEQ
jgi:hypothetical protein